MRAYVDLLVRRKHFRTLWFAQLVSLLGDWFNSVALVILVNRYAGTGVAVGTLFVARALPPFFIGPLAGVVADRFNRKMVLVMTDLLRFVIVLGFLLVDQKSEVWLIYVLTVAQFSVAAFFEPARAAILPSVVETNELLAANTISSTTWSATLAFGAAIGGAVAAKFGVEVALVIDAASFLLSALIVIPLRINRRLAPTGEPTSGWTDMLDGFRYVARRPNIFAIAGVKAMGQVGNVDVIIAVFAQSVFVIGKEGAATIGLLWAFHGVGSVIGPIVGNMLGNKSVRYLTNAIVIGYASLPVAWLLLGVGPTLFVAGMASMLRGAGASVNWTYSSVLLQMKVPDQFLGRVFALDFSLFTLAMSLAVWLTGFAMDTFDLGPRQMCYILAVGSIVPFFVWLMAARRLNRTSPATT